MEEEDYLVTTEKELTVEQMTALDEDLLAAEVISIYGAWACMT